MGAGGGDPPPSPPSMEGGHQYVENRSRQYVESKYSFVHGIMHILALRGIFHFVTMWKIPDLFATWKSVVIFPNLVFFLKSSISLVEIMYSQEW